MNEDNRPERSDDRIYEEFYDMKSVMSTTDMTGLTPTPPLTEEDSESYSEIHGMPVPGDPPKKKRGKNDPPEEPWFRR